jgi:NADH:ubiquinone oxidoreductase subunit F (NADH-binding)
VTALLVAEARPSAVAGLPGIPTAGRAAGTSPRQLLAPGVLLLADVQPGQRVEVDEHLRRWGPCPDLTLSALVDAAARERIVGAGGAAFPTDRKLSSLSGRRVSHVVVNGAEGESASGKDGVLLGHVPHLVLDGAVAAARALGADRVVVRISADRPDVARSLPREVAHRTDPVPVAVSVGPASFAAGEATAVIRAIAGGPALPADLGRPPVVPGRPARRRAHVLLSNVETFARLAVAARGHGADSALASASGAVHRPGVVELAGDAALADLAASAGGVVGSPRLLITGGWHGRWIRWDGATGAVPLTRDGVAGAGGRWGAGAFVWVPEAVDPAAALAAVAAELAEGTAGQCGPCWRGLPEVAERVARWAEGSIGREQVEALLAEVDGRGICAHPSTAVAALRTAMDLVGGLR